MARFNEFRKTAQEGNLVKFPVEAIEINEGTATTIIFHQNQSLQPLSDYRQLIEFLHRNDVREAGTEVSLTIEENPIEHALIVTGDFADVLIYLQKAELMHSDTVDEIKIQFLLLQLARVLQNLPINKIPALKLEIEKSLEEAEKKFVAPPPPPPQSTY